MIKSIDKDYIITNCSSIFRIAYIIDLFVGCIALLEGFSFAMRFILMPLGIVIILYNYLKHKTLTKVDYYKVLLLFLLSCLITSLMHCGHHLPRNLVLIMHFSICFFIFFASYIDTSFDKLKKEMLIIAKFIIYANFGLSLLGILIAITKVQINIGKYWLGMYCNRLIGVYTNSNLLALISVLSLFIVHIFFSLKKIPKSQILFYIINVIVSFISLILSDSNGSFMFLIIYITVMIFYKLFYSNNNLTVKTIFLKSMVLIIACVCISISSFAIRSFCQENIATFINETHSTKEPIHDNNLSDVPYNIGQDNFKNNSQPLIIGRSVDNNSRDITSGRITLIKQALFMFKKNPVMGVGLANIVEYGARYINGGLIFSDFHNGYLTILVSYGIIGFSIFMIFSFLVAILMCKNLFKIEKPYPNLFAIIVGYCIYSLIEVTILSNIVFMVVIFWLILGYAMSYIKNYEHKSKEV